MWTLTKKEHNFIRKAISKEFTQSKLARIQNFLEQLADNSASNDNGDQHGQQFLFPDLAAKPVYEVQQFPWALNLEKNFNKVLNDYTSCIEKGSGSKLYLAEDEPDYTGYLENDKLFAPNKRWKAVFICRDGVFDKRNKRLCANTLNLVKAARIGGGDIMFSILQKKTEIVPHYGLNNLHLTCHLGISVNKLSYLKVNSQKHRWSTGKCLIFDDTFLHSAANNSSKDRVIFLFDFWHPDLSATEIKVLKQILPQIEALQRS